MTVLFVTHYSGFYGANKSLLTLICMLRDCYNINPIVLLPNDGVFSCELKNNDITYVVFHYYWWVNDNHGVFQWLLNLRKQLINLWRVGRLSHLFKKRTIDLVYSNSICVNIGYLLAKRLGVSHIWQARESFDSFSLKFSLPLPLSRSLLASPINKKYLLISNYMMDFYKKYLPFERMVRIYNGVDLPQGTYRSNQRVINDRLRIACVGVISDQKNQLELLRAQELLIRRGIEVEVWLLGLGNPSYVEKVYSFVHHAGLDTLVHFVGHTEDVFSVLQKMNLGVVTARDEAFGRVTIEYMLMGMPVIASRSGANAELIECGVTGEVYPLGDVNVLANTIEHYVNQPGLLEKQGVAAEQKARRDFSAEKNAALIYEQINKVVNQ